MFTGLVQATATAYRVDARLKVTTPPGFRGGGLQAGESIAVNGVCLTLLAAPTGDAMEFNLSDETLRRTSFGSFAQGNVNLERALRVGDRLGGHFVQGHVDAIGQILSVSRGENEWSIRVQAPPEIARFLVDKGSVTVDGVSLTVVSPIAGAFTVAVIPHTLEHTNLSDRSPDDVVNLEADILMKHVEALLRRS